MANLIRPLALLLVAQLGLALFTSGLFTNDATEDLSKSFFEFPFAEVDQIVITTRKEEGKTEEKILSRSKDGWILPEYFNFPVDESKLELFKDGILDAHRSFPVGNTSAAAKQFEVTDSNFQKKVRFKKGDTVLGDFYIGTSPAYRKVHVRVGKEAKTYALELDGYALDKATEAWADKNLLSLKSSDISGISIGGISLKKEKDGAMSLTDLSSDEEPNAKEIEDLVKKISGLRFTSVLGTEEKEEYHLESPIVSFAVTTSDGKTIDYKFGAGPDEKTNTLKVSSFPYYFSVLAFQLKPFQEITRDGLIKEKQLEEKAPQEESTPQTSEAPTS